MTFSTLLSNVRNHWLKYIRYLCSLTRCLYTQKYIYDLVEVVKYWNFRPRFRDVDCYLSPLQKGFQTFTADVENTLIKINSKLSSPKMYSCQPLFTSCQPELSKTVPCYSSFRPSKNILLLFPAL